MKFLTLKKIKQESISFLKSIERLNEVPLDVESIIERSLSLEIIPINGLYKTIKAECYLSSDRRSIVIDDEYYMNESFYKRLRFTLAHEIGHYVLHKEYYNGFADKNNFKDFHIRHRKKIPGIEFQANMFAGFLLMPSNIFMKKMKEIDAFNYTKVQGLEDYDAADCIAYDVMDYFDVSVECAANRVRTFFRHNL